MDSEALIRDELTRRLRILEGALGIELDSSSECSGDPENCNADPCSPDRCPVSNNILQRLAADFGSMSQDFALLTQLVEGLRKRGLVTEGMLREAKLQVQLREVREELRESNEALLTITQESVVGQTIAVGAQRLKQREAALLRELEDL